MDSCGGGATGGYAFDVKSGYPHVALCGQASSVPFETMSATKVDDGKWHHVAVIADMTSASHTVQLVIDGVADAAVTISSIGAMSAAGSTGFIGGALGTDVTINGDLDEIRFWSVKRTTTQLKNNRARFLDCTTANLAIAYGFDEAIVTDRCMGTVVTNVGGTIVASGVFNQTQALVNFGPLIPSLGSITAVGATSLSLGAVDANSQAFRSGASVYRASRADRAALDLVGGGDFETPHHSFQALGHDAGGGVHVASMAFVDYQNPLSGTGSLHVIADNPCAGGDVGLTDWCPVTAYGGVLTTVAGADSHTPSGFLVDFDYKVVSGSFHPQARSNAVGYPLNVDLAPAGLTSATKRHFEGVHMAPASGSNYFYFLSSNSSEFYLDNVRMLPLLLANDFEAAALPAGWNVNVFCGTSGRNAAWAQSGTYGWRVGNCLLAGTGMTSSNVTTVVGNWYAVSFWIWVDQGSYVQFDVLDQTNAATNVSLKQALQGTSGAGGQWVRVSTAFQATGTQTQLSWTVPDNATFFAIDDVALYQVEQLDPVRALPSGAAASTFSSVPAAGGAADTCYYVTSPGVPPNGRLLCSQSTTISNHVSAFGPGVSCPITAAQNAPCTGTTTAYGGTTDGALLVDGNNTFSFLGTGVGNIPAGGAWSVSMWARPRKSQSGTDFRRDSPPLLGLGSAFGVSNSFSLWNLVGGLRGLICGDAAACGTDPTTAVGGGSWTGAAYAGGALAFLNWTHIVVSYDDTTKTAKVYRNGFGPGTSVTSGVSSTAGYLAVNLGAMDSTLVYTPTVSNGLPNIQYSVENFDGWIDNVRTFSRPLNQEESAGICNTEAPPSGVVCAK
ncbi:MAG: laminin G domain-containing protein [Deltaproteobacteria bacterium]|nr:laminin G domain-containing protein [Deltaproteobacteria bacterium]